MPWLWRRSGQALGTAVLILVSARPSGAALSRSRVRSTARPVSSRTVVAPTTLAKTKSTASVVTAGAAPLVVPGDTPVGSPPTRVTDALLLPDAATVRNRLYGIWGFPRWWPVPDQIVSRVDQPSTLQQLSIGDDAFGDSRPIRQLSFLSAYYLPESDPTVVRQLLEAKLAGSPYDIAAGRADTGERNGRIFIHMIYPANDRRAKALSLDIVAAGPARGRSGGPPTSVGRASSGVIASFSTQIEVPGGSRSLPTVPVLTPLNDMAIVPGSVFRSARLDVRVTGFLGDGALGTYRSTWVFPAGPETAAKSYLGDAANYKASVLPVGPPSVGAKAWTQKLTWNGLTGDVAVVTGNHDVSIVVHLTLA